MGSPSSSEDPKPSTEVVVRGQACLAYDADGARLVLVRGEERHEIRVRPQVHSLVRYMAERNRAAPGESPVLCAHDELMEAVWLGEPLHSRGELAKLVWELRKALEPLGAADLLENEPRRGYRLRTCPAPSPALPAARPPERVRRVGGVSRPLAAVAILVAVGVAVVASVLVLTGRGGGASGGGHADVATFVDRIENVLEQSSGGRREISSTLAAGLRCSIPPRVAGQRIASVTENRQSILDQLDSQPAPTRATATVVTLLQRALQQSVEADRHYRDGFFNTPRPGCPIPPNRDFVLAGKSDVAATAAKERFVVAFNRLARRFDRRTWLASEI